MASRIVGIDLGTSTSVVCALISGQPVVIADSEGNRIHPSVVHFPAKGDPVVGWPAKKALVTDPENTVASVKRLVGRSAFAPEIDVARRISAARIVRGADNNPKVEVRGHAWAPEEIQAFTLRYLRKVAEDFLGEPVERAVITVPANFNDAQRLATRNAAQIAGIEAVRILNEPTAAALAYGYEQGKRERIVVYDFGGGTFDVTILELRGNVFEVLATAGNTFLGGDDFDQRIAEGIAETFDVKHGVDLRKNPAAMQRLKAAAEAMKHRLSFEESATATIHEILPGHGPATLEYLLDRTQFEKRCMDIVQRTFLVCDEALKLAKLTSSQVDRLVLVGGTTRIPLVRQMVEQYFFKKPLTNINPDEVVGIGAAIYAWGLEAAPASRAVEKGAASTGGPPPPPPGKATAPAAPLLVDVTPQALGVETVGQVMDIVVERNAPIPARFTRIFTTTRDNQDVVRIQVFEGSARRTTENRKLGEVLLDGLRAAQRGSISIAVTFEVNADGMLNVTARDTLTQQTQSVRLSVVGGLDPVERDRLAAGFGEVAAR